MDAEPANRMGEMGRISELNPSVVVDRRYPKRGTSGPHYTAGIGQRRKLAPSSNASDVRAALTACAPAT
jgi:hypothetical protein